MYTGLSGSGGSAEVAVDDDAAGERLRSSAARISFTVCAR
jgi:hypothetical protein